ncbi:MAG: hypothetical protein AB9846_17590 [Tenuifilaceae bacterium]
MERCSSIKKNSLAPNGAFTILNSPIFGKSAPSNIVYVAVKGVKYALEVLNKENEIIFHNA